MLTKTRARRNAVRLVAAVLPCCPLACHKPPAETTGTPAHIAHAAGVVWQRFRPPVGSASAEFPGRPDEMPRPIGSDETRLFSYAAPKSTAFQLGVSKLPPDAARFTPEEQLERVRESTGRGLEREAVSTRPPALPGVPTSDFTLVLPDGNRLRYVVAVRGEHYYVLTVAGTRDAVTGADAERFFASLRFE